MNLFCCYFDGGFAARGLAMLRSLERVAPGSRAVALCLDEAALRAARALAPSGTELMTLEALEARDPGLARVKGTRTRAEYHLTCTPVLPLALLEDRPEVERVTYLDADLWFFSDPAPVLAGLGDAPAALTPQDSEPARAARNATGRFNDGWTTVRRSEEGLRLLRWWRERCLEWCHDRVEAGRYTEQRYLDEWPLLEPRVRELTHRGVNVGPWSVGRRRVEAGPAGLTVDGEPLVAYHFSGVRRLAGPLYNTRLGDYEVTLDGALRRLVYAPYLAELRRLEKDCARASGTRTRSASRVGFYRPGAWESLRLLARGLARGQYVMARGA